MEESSGTTRCDSRVRAVTAASAAALALAGCIVIPTPTMPVNDIPAAQREALRAEKATRADIVLRFGEPDLRIDADRVLVYRWTRTRGLVLGVSFAFGLEDVEAVFLEFGDDGRLYRIGTTSAWRKSTVAEQAEAWARDRLPP